MKALMNKDRFTSLELVDLINQFRQQEGNRKKLKHKTLLDIIRDEFEEEINGQKILPVEYRDQKGEMRPMFILTLSESRQVLLRESKFVRKSVIKYIEKLEKKLQELMIEKSTAHWLETRRQGKLTRRAETDTIKELVEYARGQGSKNADKLYMIYSKLANKMAGVENRDSAGVMELNNLSLIEGIILSIIRQGMAEGKHYKAIYQDCKQGLATFREVARIEEVARLEVIG